jgi:hypothetical protein
MREIWAWAGAASVPAARAAAARTVMTTLLSTTRATNASRPDGENKTLYRIRTR